MSKTKPSGLPIHRVWGGTLNLFLAGDLFAAFFLPLWLAAGKEGITEGDAAQMILSCLLLFAVTLALRLAVWGLGRLFDRRVLGELEQHRLRWGERIIDQAGESPARSRSSRARARAWWVFTISSPPHQRHITLTGRADMWRSVGKAHSTIPPSIPLAMVWARDTGCRPIIRGG